MSLNRRDFLRTTAALAALSAADLARAEDKKEGDDFNGFTVGENVIVEDEPMASLYGASIMLSPANVLKG